MHYLFAIAFVLFTSTTFADQNVQIPSGLTDAQIAQLRADAAKTAAENAKLPSIGSLPDISTPDKINQWVDVGSNLGKALGGAAREVGVAASEFIQTPIGKVAALIIVWKLIGHDLMHVFGSAMFLSIGITSWFILLRRYTYGDITYDKEKTDIFKRSRILKIERRELTGEMIFLFSAGIVVVLGVSMIILFGS